MNIHTNIYYLYTYTCIFTCINSLLCPFLRATSSSCFPWSPHASRLPISHPLSLSVSFSLSLYIYTIYILLDLSIYMFTCMNYPCLVFLGPHRAAASRDRLTPRGRFSRSLSFFFSLHLSSSLPLYIDTYRYVERDRHINSNRCVTYFLGHIEQLLPVIASLLEASYISLTLSLCTCISTYVYLYLYLYIQYISTHI